MLAPQTSAACVTGCTDVGCFSGVSIDLQDWTSSPAGSTVRACANDRCEDRPVVGGAIRIDIGTNRRVVAREVSVQLRGPDDSLIVTAELRGFPVREMSPNGKRCGPTCATANLILDSDGRLDVALPPD